METKQIIFKQEPKRGATNIRQWNIQTTKSSLGWNVCDGLLFIHVILGCDTTSQLLGIGKGEGRRSCKIYHSWSMLMYSTTKIIWKKISLMPVPDKMLLVPCMEEGHQKLWMNYDTVISVQRWLTKCCSSCSSPVTFTNFSYCKIL